MKFRHTVLAIAVCALAAPAFAAGDHPHGHRGDGPRGPAMMQGMDDPERMIRGLGRWLDLDQQQEQELENIALAARPQFDALRERARSNHEAIRMLDVADENYETRVHELATESGQIATEMTLLGARLRADVNAILTPEQQQELRDAHVRMRERFERKRN